MVNFVPGFRLHSPCIRVNIGSACANESNKALNARNLGKERLHLRLRILRSLHLRSTCEGRLYLCLHLRRTRKPGVIAH